VYQKQKKKRLENIHLGLERNETAPKRVLPEPRVPSKKEREEAVQFVIPPTSDVSVIYVGLYVVISLAIASSPYISILC